ncbi:MAG: DUF3098 domain-containing protein [Saprospiraceae bacterium]
MSKKKVVSTKKKNTGKVTPTSARGRASVAAPAELLFGKQNYMFMAIGFGLILLGMLLMSGGGMDDPNTWDPDVIYSTRRTLLAPIVILAGLGMQIYAIFLKK